MGGLRGTPASLWFGGGVERLLAHRSVRVEAISLLQAFGFVCGAASGAARVARRGPGWLLVILV